MRTIKFLFTFSLALVIGFYQVNAQEESENITEEEMDSRDEIQNFRYNDQRGLNVFEAPKDDTPYKGFGLRIGGDFAIQYQAISQSNNDNLDTLADLGNNFNLPTANLNMDAQLYPGLRMHLRTYLSSRHHPEAWVKGGYIRIDRLDFIQKDFLSSIMDYTFVKIGMDEINYGDAHFRRSDNARAIYNPFVGNYIMDAFTTEPFAEVTVMHPSGFLAVAGASNGRLNQSVADNKDEGMSFYGKLGYDKQMNEDLRFRLTGSIYTSSNKSTRDYLYNGDRAGARYYGVLQSAQGGGDFDPRFNPRFSSMTAFQINPFVKFQGFELFGIFESSSNNIDSVGGSFTQIGAEALYRFGGKEQFYVGGRYNSVSGKFTKNADELTIDRINGGAGWYITRNTLVKAEYVTSTYDGGLTAFGATRFEGLEWNGVVLEATIGF